jgi:hypothetical protein
MSRLWLLVTLFLATSGLATQASAQESLAKFIEGYNAVKVHIQDGSNECGIKDQMRYNKSVDQKLSAIGLKADPLAIPTAYLRIVGKAFGPLKQQGAIFMSLRLGTDITAAAVKIDATLESDQILIEKFRAVLGTFPSAFFITSTLFVKLTPSAPDAIDEGIDVLVKSFNAARQ